MATYTQRMNTGYSLQLNLTETVNSSANTSTIEYSIYFIADAGYWYHFNYQNELYFSLGGNEIINTANIKSIAVDGQSLLLASGSWTYQHNDDGSGSFSIFCRFRQMQDLSYTAQISDTFVCTNIAGASNITATGGTLGTASVTISITKESSSYTTTLTYKVGNASGTIATKTANTSVTWTPPESLASQNTVGTTLSCEITAETYSGNTKVGTSVAFITLEIPDTICADITSLDADETGSGLNILFVQGKSQAVITLTATTANAYGATIKTCTLSIDGVDVPITLQQSGTTWTGTVTSGVLKSAGDVDIDAMVIDSRGNFGIAATTIEVESYEAPRINSFSATRCNASGVAQDDGEYVHVVASMSHSDLSGYNSYRAVLTYVSSSGGTATTKTYYVNSIDVILPASGEAPFSATTGYSFTLTVSDNYTSLAAMDFVPTAFALVDYRNTGKGIAFGKISEADTFDVDLDAQFRKGISLIQNDGAEQGILFQYAGAALHSLMLYKGDANSTTLLGLKDVTSGATIMRYCSDGKVYFDVPIVTV